MAISTRSHVREGQLTRKVEEQTARIPSLGYLGFAFGSIAVSASLAFFFKKRDWANFIGLWAPSILLLGLYNKVVKVEHEQQELLERKGLAA